MCDYWMPINALVRLLGMGAIQATPKEVLALEILTKAHGRSDNILELMTVEAEGKK